MHNTKTSNAVVFLSVLPGSSDPVMAPNVHCHRKQQVKISFMEMGGCSISCDPGNSSSSVSLGFLASLPVWSVW